MEEQDSETCIRRPMSESRLAGDRSRQALKYFEDCRLRELKIDHKTPIVLTLAGRDMCTFATP